MFKMWIKNSSGEVINFNDDNYRIEEVEGLDCPDINISTYETATMDGEVHENSKIKGRHLKIAFQVIALDVEEARLNVYRILQPKKQLTVYYQSDKMNIFTKGSVSGISVDYFAMRQIIIVYIDCPKSEWESMEEEVNELSAVTTDFIFPFHTVEPIPFSHTELLNNTNIENKSHIDTGLTIEVYVDDYIEELTIFDYVTKEYLKINGTLIPNEDYLIINTNQGEKSVISLKPSGKKANYFNRVDVSSTWLQLNKPVTTFIYTVGVGKLEDVHIKFKHRDKYLGV